MIAVSSLTAQPDRTIRHAIYAHATRRFQPSGLPAKDYIRMLKQICNRRQQEVETTHYWQWQWARGVSSISLPCSWPKMLGCIGKNSKRAAAPHAKVVQTDMHDTRPEKMVGLGMCRYDAGLLVMFTTRRAGDFRGRFLDGRWCWWSGLGEPTRWVDRGRGLSRPCLPFRGEGALGVGGPVFAIYFSARRASLPPLQFRLRAMSPCLLHEHASCSRHLSTRCR